MHDQPGTNRDDVAYWGLTHAQAAHHDWRVSDYHAKQARRFADIAIDSARKAEIGCWVSGALIAVVLVLRVVAMVIE